MYIGLATCAIFHIKNLVTLVEKRSKDIIENIPSGALLAF
jgi:uncharacterized FlaG/YvyC family protein